MSDRTAVIDDARNVIADLVTRARAAGADAADAIGLSQRSVSVSYRLGAVEELERSEDIRFGLRVLIGGRQAVVSSSDPKRAARAMLAERAVAMARSAPDDPNAGLAESTDLADGSVPPDLDLFDASWLEEDRLKALASKAEDAARAVDGVTNSLGAGASQSERGVALATSHGFEGVYKASSFAVSASVLAGEGTAMERDYAYADRRHFSDLEPAADIGRLAGERAVARLGSRRIESAKVPILFDPRVAGSLLSHFAMAVNGGAVARGTSFLKDKMGQPVFAPGIRVIDDARLPRGLRSRPFDGEGVGTQSLALVEDGRLESWILSAATARQLGLETTGHANRGLTAPPSPGSTNLYLAPGKTARADLIGSVERGFYVTELIGQGVNPVTGDYSRGAAGFWIENGALSYPVSEVTVAGNLKAMFASLEPASDLEFRYAVNAPTVRIDGMTIAGA